MIEGVVADNALLIAYGVPSAGDQRDEERPQRSTSAAPEKWGLLGAADVKRWGRFSSRSTASAGDARGGR